MFALTKTWCKWHVKVNQNQRRFALVAALAASALPSLVLARGRRIKQVTQKPFTTLSVFVFATTSQPLKHSLGSHSTSSSEMFLLGNLAAQHGSISYTWRDVILTLTQQKNGSY